MEFSQLGLSPKAPINIIAASSLAKSLPQLIKSYQAATGLGVHALYQSSGACVQHIQSKNPFDLILTADVSYMNKLVALNLIRKGSVHTLGAGKLALATHTPLEFNPLMIQSLHHCAFIKIAIPQPNLSPYGHAARQALAELGILHKIEAQFLYAKDALHALNLLRSKIVDAAFTSDLLINSSNISYSTIDDYLHPALAITSGIIRGSHHVGASLRFLDYLQSPATYSLLSKMTTHC
jgi:molybdate transport system substrate-binding protein